MVPVSTGTHPHVQTTCSLKATHLQPSTTAETLVRQWLDRGATPLGAGTYVTYLGVVSLRSFIIISRPSFFVKASLHSTLHWQKDKHTHTHKLCVTCVHSPLFDDRVWQFSLPAFETQKLHCLGASDWSTPPS